MALEKYNIEIEGLDYKEYDSNDLYFEINLYDLIKNKVSEPIVSSKYDGLDIFCNKVGFDRLDSNGTSSDYSKMDKLVIPEHIKYLILRLDLERYDNIVITHELEYV